MLQNWQARLKNMRPRRVLLSILMVLLAVGMLAYLLYRERDVLLNFSWQIRALPLVMAFVLYTIALWLAALVWVWIIRSLGARLDFFQHISYFYVSLLARRLPGTVWYVAYLARVYKDEGFSPWLTSLGSGLELVVMVISGALVSLLFAVEQLVRYPLGGVGIAVLVLVCLAFLHPRFIRWLLRRIGSQAQPPPTSSLLKWVGVYVVVRLLGGVVIYCLINVIYPLPLETLPFITGAWALVGVLSYLLLLSLSNLGFTEVTLSLLLTTIMPSSIAVLISVGQRFLFILFELLYAIFFIGLRAILPKPAK